MRRPITFISAAFAVGIWLGYYLTWIIALIFLALFIVVLLCENKYKLYTCVLLVVIVLGISYIKMLDSLPEPLYEYGEKIISVSGKVLKIEDREGYLRILLKGETWQCGEAFGNTEKKIYVNLTLSAKELKRGKEALLNKKLGLFGKEVQLKGRLILPTGARNPGLFDYKLFLKTKRIVGTLKASEFNMEVIGDGNPALAMLGKLKARFSASLDDYMTHDAKALLLGILFGERTLIDEEIYEDFQRNGCAHILSVSGIHMSILYLYISKLFRNRRSPICSICALGLLFFYAALADYSVSVVRAFIMLVVHMLSRYLHRRYDFLCCISFSAFIMLFFNPFFLFDLGFRLSYLAVITLAFALPVAENKIGRLKQYRRYRWIAGIFQAFAPVFVIQVGMAPITAYHFQYFSFSAFFINLPVIVLAGWILPIGMGMLLLSIVGGGLFEFAATGSELLIRIMIMLNKFSGELSLSSVNVKGPSIGMLLLYYGMFFFLTSEIFWILYQKRNKRLILSICIFILCISIATPFMLGEEKRQADIVFVDVGQGDCIHLRTPSGKNILIDGGGSENYDTGKNILMPYLLKNGVNKVDLAIVTHLHQDHYGGIASLCRLMPVNQLAVYGANVLKQETILKETGLSEETLVYTAAGDRIQVEEDIYIDVLYPESQDKEIYQRLLENEEDENHASLVLQVYFRGISLLVTGDMGFEGERLLMQLYGVSSHNILQSDILKVGHHGSRYSTGDDFLDIVDPHVAVIQVGKNNFGHPHPDLIEKLSKRGIIVFRNDHDGAVLLNINGKDVSLGTML